MGKVVPLFPSSSLPHKMLPFQPTKHIHIKNQPIYEDPMEMCFKRAKAERLHQMRPCTWPCFLSASLHNLDHNKSRHCQTTSLISPGTCAYLHILEVELFRKDYT